MDYSKFDSVEDIKLLLESKKEHKNTCIFKKVIVFTNNKGEDNKTLNNIKDAIKNLPKNEQPSLHCFVAAKMDMEEDESKITIKDDKDELVLESESNIDTLIFSRLGVQGEDECEHIVQVLQDRGFLVLNPVKYSELACNKYDSALLFGKGGIPQPRFTLLTKGIINDEKLLDLAIEDVYPGYKKYRDNSDKEVVIKILGGHGGTGVFLTNIQDMISILQTIFAVDKDQRLIMQKKEDADGGDIRVHVLTLRNKQIILGAMKRIKGKSDFRSNVSLGAEAKPVKLTKEQEEIALKTAKLSKLPWCAVDIMPLVKGSNKEIGDNVVLEINASPGTDGISQVLKTNFINILFNELNDSNEFMLQNKVAGYKESITIDFGGVSKDYLAKLDTGNSTAASTIEVGEYKESGNKISFNIDGKSLSFEKVKDINALAGEETYKRPVIIIPELKLGLRKLRNVHMAIVKSRENKTTNVLLNCDALSKLGYVINPGETHLLTTEMEKVKII